MITIYEKYSEANGHKVANLIHTQIHNSAPVIIAIGDESNWHSNEPLPKDVTSLDLVQISVSDIDTSAEFWSSFLGHVILVSKMKKPKLWFLGFGKVEVIVNIDEPLLKSSVIKALKSSRLHKKIIIS